MTPRVLVVLPAIPDGLDARAKNALATRNACATEGRCPDCGAAPTLHPDPDRAEVWHLVFAHEPWCAAVADERVAA